MFSCVPGFEGVYCEHTIAECRGVQCSDGKVCFDLVNGFECRCPVGFAGSQCSEDIDECEIHSPCVNGICRNTIGISVFLFNRFHNVSVRSVKTTK